MSLYKFDITVSTPRTNPNESAFGRGLYLSGTISNNIPISTYCKLEKIINEEVEAGEFDVPDLLAVHDFTLKILSRLPYSAVSKLQSKKVVFSNNGTIFLFWHKGNDGISFEIGKEQATYTALLGGIELSGEILSSDLKIPSTLVDIFGLI